MNFSAFRLLLFMCIVILCLPCGCREKSPKSGEGINIFDMPRTSKRDNQRSAENDASARRITEAVRQAADHEKKGTSKAIVVFGIIVAAVAAVAGGLVYWKIWHQKQIEWELNDPMALVKELNFVHQLSEQEKKLMQELAERNALPSPLKLFVEPKLLLEAWEDITFDPERPLVQHLLSKLFEITPEGIEQENKTSTAIRVGADTTIYSSIN